MSVIGFGLLLLLSHLQLVDLNVPWDPQNSQAYIVMTREDAAGDGNDDDNDMM